MLLSNIADRLYEFDAIYPLVHAKPKDHVVVSGSLIDGTGTEMSDYDVYIIAPERDERFERDRFPEGHHRYFVDGTRVQSSFDYLQNSSLAVDVTYVTLAELAQAISAHNSVHAFLRNRAKIYESAVNVKWIFLHRLITGVSIQKQVEAEEILRRLDRTEFAYSAYRATITNYPDFRDVVGLWRQGEYHIAMSRLGKLLLDHLHALSHVLGNTNRNQKYLIKYMRTWPEKFTDFGARLSALKIFPDKDGARQAVLDGCDLLDDIFAALRERDRLAPGFPPKEETRRQLEAELHQGLVWHAELTREFCYRARESVDGLPRLRHLLDADDPEFAALLNDDPFRRIASQHAARPVAEQLRYDGAHEKGEAYGPQ